MLLNNRTSLHSLCVGAEARGARLRQAKAVSIEGYPDPAYNGLYTHDSTHEGWPVLKNASSRFCYRYTPQDKWMLTDDTADFAKGVSTAAIVAKEGPLPVGAHTWQVWDGSNWADGMLTLRLLVRPPPPSRSSVGVSQYLGTYPNANGVLRRRSICSGKSRG